MKLKDKIIEKFYEEPKIFRKINANSVAKIKLFVMEDAIEEYRCSYKLQEYIKERVEDFDEYFKNSIKDGKSILKDKIIEEYSVLKFYASESIDTLLEYAYKLSSNFYDKQVEIKNVLTGEKLDLSKRNQKIYLQLINNLVITKYRNKPKQFIKIV